MCPSGWADLTGTPAAGQSQSGPPPAAVCGKISDHSVIVVTTEVAQSADIPTTLAALEQSYSGTDVSSIQTFSLGGSPGRSIDFDSTVSGSPVRWRVSQALHDRTLYTIVFEASPSTDFTADLTALATFVTVWQWVSS